MVPRRKLINQVDANAMRTGGAVNAGETPEGAGSRSRTLISPNEETPISSGAQLRPRVDAQEANPAMAASSASAGSNGADEPAAINRARNDASAMPSPAWRQRRARDDGCNPVHGTSKWLDPLEHERTVGAAEPE